MKKNTSFPFPVERSEDRATWAPENGEDAYRRLSNAWDDMEIVTELLNQGREVCTMWAAYRKAVQPVESAK